MGSAPRGIKGKHILVTGGAGFLGSHLIDALIAEGVRRITAVDNLYLGTPANLVEARRNITGLQILYVDVSDARSVRDALFDLGPIDVVFNLAAVPLPICLEQPHYCFDTNVRIASVLCELLREGRYTTLVHVSSSCVYGSMEEAHPLNEKDALNPLTPYAASKTSCDSLVLSYARTFDLDVLVMRPFSIYGPRQYDRQYATVLPVLIRCALEDAVFSFFGDGKQSRDFLFVSDAVRAMIALYRCADGRGQVVNIASGQEVYIKDLKAKIEEVMKKAILCQYCESRTCDISRQCGDITLLKSLIDWEPQVTLVEGLQQTIDFYTGQMNDALNSQTQGMVALHEGVGR
jgi:UDP-glucose 4-epimerase